VGAVLAFLSATGHISIANLILFTFLGGAGAALIGPAYQSIVPELVPRSELKPAVALGSLGFNLARAIGPAVGGLLLAGAGAAVTYGAAGASCLFVILALWWWPRNADPDLQLTERFGGAIRAGWRYALASTDLRRVLFRTVIFFFFANIAWALMPLVARQVLGGGSSFYGVMLGTTGVGAVGGALFLPRVRAALGTDGLILAAALVMAGILACLSFAPPQWFGIGLSFVFGAAWIAVLTSLNSTVQGILPNWVRGRGLATYLMAFNGAMTASSLTWGSIADRIGVRPSLLIGGVCLALVALFLHRFKLPETEADLTPSNHWPEPAIADPVEHDRGPVLITVEYQVAPEQRRPFIEALTRLSQERRRDGAYAWGMSEDAAARDRILEWFFVESWAEHLRQHRRVSVADADLQAAVATFHTGTSPPKVSHYLALDRSAAGDSDAAEGREPQ
jgi:MFS family permease